MTKSSRIWSLAGSFLLLVMAGFHGSGLLFATRSINDSNAEPFLKKIFPVLFALPSLQLLGLAAFSILALFLKTDGHKVLVLVGVLVAVDGLLAIYLGGTVPALLLFGAAVAFLVAAQRY